MDFNTLLFPTAVFGQMNNSQSRPRGITVKLKREILEAQTEADAHELANILLKLNPVKESDAVLERTEQLLIRIGTYVHEQSLR
jgi:hypothetical protein